MATFLTLNCHSTTTQICSSRPLAFEFCEIATAQHSICKLSPTQIPFNLSKQSLRSNDRKLRPGYSVSCSAGVGERIGVSEGANGAETQVWEPGVDVSRDEKKKKQDALISSHGWGVLRIDHDNIDLLKQFADVQAEAFHVTTSFFNDFFFTVFKAEVLSSLLHKIRHASPKRYACLAAIPDCVKLARRRVVGVVDAAAMADKDVLRSLPGVDEYLYLSGMAVDPKYSLQKQETEGCHGFTSSMRLDSSAMGF